MPTATKPRNPAADLARARHTRAWRKADWPACRAHAEREHAALLFPDYPDRRHECGADCPPFTDACAAEEDGAVGAHSRRKENPIMPTTLDTRGPQARTWASLIAEHERAEQAEQDRAYDAHESADDRARAQRYADDDDDYYVPDHNPDA